jgi:hypothetical protein
VTRARDFVAGVVPGGEHIVWSRGGNVSALRVELEAGKTYYFDQRVRMGAVKGRVGREALSEEDGTADIAECDDKALTDEGQEKAREILASDYAEAKAKAA